jgi:hypothetical protein
LWTAADQAAIFPCFFLATDSRFPFGKSEGPAASGFPRGDGAFRWSGRLDLNQRPLAPQERSLDAQAGSSDVTTSQAVETTATHCAGHTAQAALNAAAVTGLGEPVVIPLDQLLDVAFEAEAWALDARLARAESAQKASAECGQGVDGLP